VLGRGGQSGIGPDGVGLGAPGVIGIGGGGGDVRPGNPAGVYGQGGQGNANGVEGHGSGTFSGVAGFSDPQGGGGAGVFGQGSAGNANGVQGQGLGNYAGVAGFSDPKGGGIGVWGQGSAGNANGVQGQGSGNFSGVAGFADPQGGGGAGVFGSDNGGANNVAGRFIGDVNVTGTLTAATKKFVIDHPLDPANKYLAHASVESCEQTTVYSGNIILDNRGEAVVHLPAWAEALCEDFRYQLTCVGRPALVYVADEVADDHFRIAGGLAGMKVSWQLTGIRNDAWAKAHPLVVEQDKPEAEKGIAFGMSSFAPSGHLVS
jgi:hypothetical protein